MRKMKKINGWLIVRFNDREKRLYAGVIGSYGVIDAELYTGDLDMDRGAMEYDNAETLEEAVELARGLESEEDFEDIGDTYILVTENADSCTEEEVNPQLMIEGFTGMLESRVGSEQHKDMDARAAAHELHGFKAALNRLGLIDESNTAVEPEAFGPLKEALPRSPEELLAYVCDCVCKHRGADQDEQDAICGACAMGRLYEEADAAEFQRRGIALKQLEMLRKLTAAPRQSALDAEINASNARYYIQALEDTGFIGTAEANGFREKVQRALDAQPQRQGFLNYPKNLRVKPEKLWELGERLLENCPENDCTIYRNIFGHAKELDSQRGILGGYAALILERTQNKLIRELEQLYLMSSAVRCFRVEHPNCGEDDEPGSVAAEPSVWEKRYVSVAGIALDGEMWNSGELLDHIGKRVEVRRNGRRVEARIPGGAMIGDLKKVGSDIRRMRENVKRNRVIAETLSDYLSESGGSKS